MDLDKLLDGYKLARFFFALSFFFTFVIYGKISGNLQLSTSQVILFIYFITSFVLLFYKKALFLEFLLDIIFLTVFIVFLTDFVPYLVILYLYPVFFFALLSGSKKSYIMAFFTFLITIALKTHFEGLDVAGLFLVSFLNGFSFFVISFAGLKLNEKLKRQKYIQEKLEELKKESELYKKLYHISSNIAHEIKNPLASINASAQLLKAGKYNEKLINIIYEESKRIDTLLKNFLSLSKLFSGEEKTINVYQFIIELLRSCFISKYVKVFTKDKNIEIKMNPQALESLLRNIIKNAFEWSRSKIAISIDKVGDYVYISIEDDGKGIDESIKEHIFEPFFSTRKNGTGLGLAIAKNIALNYKGDILVEKSELLGGAKFTVILPVEVKDESPRGRR